MQSEKEDMQETQAVIFFEQGIVVKYEETCLS